MNWNLNDSQYNFSCQLSDEFVGPLDVLLELIQKKKMSIKNIDIKELTDQFVTYVVLMKDKIPLEIFSEYAHMCAYLIELKTRSLSPDYDDAISKYNKSLESEKESFIKRLLEYQMYKNSILALNLIQIERSLYLDKANEDLDEFASSNVPLAKLPKKLDIFKLKEIMEAIIDRNEIKLQLKNPIDLHIQTHEYPVSEVIVDLMTYLVQNKEGTTLVNFFLNGTNFTKRNIDYFCMLFFVVLSLIHQNKINLELTDNDIYLKIEDTILLNNQTIDQDLINSLTKELLGD